MRIKLTHVSFKGCISAEVKQIKILHHRNLLMTACSSSFKYGREARINLETCMS